MKDGNPEAASTASVTTDDAQTQNHSGLPAEGEDGAERTAEERLTAFADWCETEGYDVDCRPGGALPTVRVTTSEYGGALPVEVNREVVQRSLRVYSFKNGRLMAVPGDSA